MELIIISIGGYGRKMEAGDLQEKNQAGDKCETKQETNLEDCPSCDNVGWYGVSDWYTGELEQEQCEFCYTNPNSIFNHLEKVRKLKELLDECWERENHG